RDGCVKETRALSQPSSSVIHLHDTAPKRRTFPKCPALVRQMEGVEREAGRLLVIPAFGSHWSGMKPLVEELGRRGHEVVVVFPEENPKLKPAKHATTIRYPVTYTNDEMEKNMEVGLDKMLNVDVSTNLAKFVSFYITLDLLNVVITRNAESLMTNDDLMKKLQSYNFDAILTDPFETVGIIASEYLSIPTIYMQTSHPCGVDALVTQCPAPPSYVPQGLTHFTNNMDLWQRSINFLRSLYQPQACRRMFNRADEIASHVLQKKITAKEILSRAALWFMHFDFAFELPRPLMPNMVLIGGVDTKKAEPLSQKLDYKTSLKQRVDSEPQNSLAHKPSTHLCIDRMAASLLLSCFFCLGLAEAGKLLVLPSDGSHWTGMRPLVEELGKKGHEVVVVIPEASLSMGPSQHTTTLTYPVPYTKTQLLEQVNAGVSTLISAPVSTDLARFQSYMNTMDLLSVLTTRNVNGFFSEKDLMKKLRDYDFDAILTDPFEPIGVIASEFLSLPAIYVQSGHPCSADALAAQRPAPPSYVPHGFTFFTDRMNLWQRSVNFIRTLLQPMACGRMFVHADEIATRVLQRKTSMLEILTRAALWFLLLSLFLIGSSEAGKLLVVPSDGSHWLGMRPVVEELGRRGNQVVVVIPDASLSMGPSKNTTTLTFPVNYTKAELHTLLEGNLTDILTIDLSSDFSKFFVFFYQLKVLQNFIVRNAEGLLFNEDLMKKLKDYQFDAILTDPFEPVGVIVGEYLSIPAIYMQINLPCAVDTLASQCPSPPSYVPQRNTHFTEKMNLWQRSINLIRTILQPFGCRYLHTEADAIASRLLQKKTSVMEIMHKASLWFMRFDFAFEFPRPLMPNMVMIGGMATKNPKPLSQELEEFVNGSGDDGFVVFTLGSMVSQLPEAKAREFFEAFRQIPQRVLWRYTGKVPEDAPKNVKLMKWLPQNDLLGHAKVKAFITHGGSHGIYEGICNGVPMVMLPLFGDQGDNVQRLVSRGVAESLSIYDVTSEKLLVALRKVINDKSYKEKMTKLSSIHRDRPIEPLDLAVFWTEFVMRHKGAAHLRPAAHELNWIQYHSLDVIGFLLLILVTVVFVSVKSCMFCFRKCVKRIQKKKKE
ncbi:hypothetical protein DNTS_024115, partial [Danionella cerebrum]